MPIYEYICDNCGEELEMIQKITEDPLKDCPSCNEATLKKKTSMSAFHLKGGGWYKDGYGASNGKSDSKPSTGSVDTKPKTVSSDKKESTVKNTSDSSTKKSSASSDKKSTSTKKAS